ncbi:hypothetical protein H7U37_12725 [Pseudoflavonifractor phocaeensis]|uniref:hypothetical protein n=1 Tax=Pseudoflavonifractor phocaeensis TaxID=1870988 RepID=UPI00195CDA4B|nr:hypothetical protein [Pseudoflavonifractor phocaeensis]MBM6939377.1 hypothetical protein [Pseudoflavonifractor phocaeensis]
MSASLNREERLQLNRARQKAVREAWAREKSLCAQGKGTRNWTRAEQRELLATGRVKGYEGQHMKSVSQYPAYAGSAENIQFLTHQEHLNAHNSGPEKSGYRSPTNGYYDTATGQMHAFGQAPPTAPQAAALSHPCVQSQSGGQEGPSQGAGHTGPSQAASASHGQGVSG